MKNVTLIGMPGSGKSTVGVLLAKALGYAFLDVDLVIQHREGALLQDIIDTRGVDAFLDCEEQAVCSISCGVLKIEMLARTVPVSNVPALIWAVGAQ